MAKRKKPSEISLDIKPMQKKIMQLHFPPSTASKNIHALLESFRKEEGINQDLVLIYEDIANIVDWAIERMHILPPPTKKGETKEGEEKIDEKAEEKGN